MKLPEMPYQSALTKSYQSKFGGYNHTLSAGDGEIYNIMNMTSDDIPVLSSRSPRNSTSAVSANNGIIAIESVIYRVHYNSLYQGDTYLGSVSNTKKTFATMPYYLVVYPDKKVVRLDVKGYYSDLSALNAAVSSPKVNDIYGIGSSGNYVIYYWDGTEWEKSGKVVEDIEASWSGYTTFLAKGTYFGVEADNNTIYAHVNWADYFRVGDAVEISGCAIHEENNKTAVIREISETLIRFSENTFTLDQQWGRDVKEDGDFIIADYLPTSPYYTNLKSFYFKTDNELIVFQPNPAIEDVPSDTDLSTVFIMPGYWFLYDGEKLYYAKKNNSSFLQELASYSAYEKVDLIGGYQYKALGIKVSRKTFYYELNGDTVLITLTNEQYAIVKDQVCDFILVKDFNVGGGGQLFIQNDFVAIDFAVEGVTLGDKVGFYMESLDYHEPNMTIKRPAPEMDFIVGHRNRLWGCKGSKIYASKLGDPFNFNVFDGLSTDSYMVDTGTTGDFTGAFSYLGYPLFFKEDSIVKVYGDKPSEYQTYDTATRGVAKGSDRSLCVAGETLYYHNKSGIMAYTGGVPALVSSVFGGITYKNGKAGSDGNKYYVYLQDKNNYHHLFVYDPSKNVWMKENIAAVTGFINKDGLLWVHTGVLTALTGTPTGITAEGDVNWEVEFADFYADSPNKKGVSKLHIRLNLASTASAKAYIRHEGETTYSQASTEMKGTYKKSHYLPIIPRRDDNFSVKITGTGKCEIYSLSIEYYAGSQL